MKVTIFGYGNIGAALTKQLTAVGHDVIVTGRDLDKAAALAKSFASASAQPVEEAVTSSDFIVLAVHFDGVAGLLEAAGDLSDKIFIDPTNPLTADFMGLTMGYDTSAAEQIAAMAPSAYVVKALNTLFAQVIDAGPDFSGSPATVFLAGDDMQAKKKVEGLVKTLGYEVTDVGPLKNARYLEPVAGLNIYLGYGAGLGTQIAPTWMKR